MLKFIIIIVRFYIGVVKKNYFTEQKNSNKYNISHKYAYKI